MTDATARLETRERLCIERGGWMVALEVQALKTELRRDLLMIGELYSAGCSCSTIEQVEGKIMVLLVVAKASRTLFSSSVGFQCVLLSCCLDQILELLFCAACLQLMAPQ
jgi:hypothetical protein